MLQHLSVTQQFSILSRKMLHDLLDIMISAHGGVKLLLGLQFSMPSKDALTNTESNHHTDLWKVEKGKEQRIRQLVPGKCGRLHHNPSHDKHCNNPECRHR